MTREVGKNILIIEPQPDERCEMCGAVDELRPYGPKGENVCFTCGMKDREAAERQFAKRLGITTH
jgi:hypothetical protein